MQQLQLSEILRTIKFVILNEKEIKKEFNKLIAYYMENPDLFSCIVNETKELLEAKNPRTILENNTLKQINDYLIDLDIKKYYKFQDKFFLNDIRKIYIQIRDFYPVSVVTNNELVNIMFYSIMEEPNPEDNSKLFLNMFTVKARDFMLSYQMLYN